MQPLDIAGAPPYVRGVLSSPVEGQRPRKRWWRYIPLAVTICMILAPHPPILYTLVQHYIITLHSPLRFIVHLLAIYSFTFLTFSSLILCSVRDPGPVNDVRNRHSDTGVEDEDEMSFTQALMVSDGDDFNSPAKWCRKCWMPKPERAHHCSVCDRCVLKMDHHCPWVADKCIGHWTYPAFLHFLFFVTSLALYVAVLEGHLTWTAFVDPYTVDETVAVNSLLLAVTGIIFAITIGSFFGYHIYLVTTNQTTLETLSPFLILRYLPLESTSQVPIVSSVTGRPFSQPPEEFELSSAQRRLVRRANSDIRMYDLGWKQNWVQVFGWKRRWGWVPRVLYGGGSYGDGRTFPRSALMEERLAELASRVVNEDKLA